MSCPYTVVAWNPWIRAVVKNVLVHPVSALHHINGFILTAHCRASLCPQLHGTISMPSKHSLMCPTRMPADSKS